MNGLRQSALRSLLKTAGYLPRRPARTLFGVVGLLGGAVSPGRLTEVRQWTERVAPGRRIRAAVRLLAHSGTTLVDTWAPIFETPADLTSRVRIVGTSHLDAVAASGGILLGFHLGVPLTNWTLRAYGYQHVLTGTGVWAIDRHAAFKPGWADVPPRETVTFPAGPHGDRQRAVALFRILGLLRSGRMVRVIADGSDGARLFVVPVGHRALVVRKGWWLLRRQARVPVVPILAHAEGAGAVLTAYPPLPSPVPDPFDDAEQCRAPIAALLQQFVAAHPEQCLPWRFQSVEYASGSKGTGVLM